MDVRTRIVLRNILKTPVVLCIRLPVVLVLLVMIKIGDIGNWIFDDFVSRLPAWDMFPDTKEDERRSIERYVSSVQVEGEQPLVQDKKTGEWYNPKAKWEELQRQQWYIDLMVRMSKK